MTYKRNRLLYVVMIISVIILGLFTRKINSEMPYFFKTYFGDALWALMIFLAFGFIFSEMKTWKVALTGIIFCYLIELSQLYHAHWIDNMRNTTLGGVVLGYGFSWTDLLAYAIGIGACAIIDILLRKNFKSKK